MIIFLYGSDSYRSRQKLNEIINHYKESGKTGLNLLSVDAEKTNFQDFYDNFRTSSMFAERKLVIVKNMFAVKQFQEDFLEQLESIETLSDVVVIYESEAVDERLKLFKTLTKECLPSGDVPQGHKCQEFSLLEPKQVKAWAQKEFENLKQKINVDALDLLVASVGNDLWRLAGELQKLSQFKAGDAIKKEDIALLVRPNIETDIFKTIDALAQKNKIQALRLLQKHLANGEEPLYLLSMVVYQFRTLLVIKELAQKGLMYNSIVKKSGLHPFVVRKNYFVCQQFSLEDLKAIYQKIFQIDTAIKTGKAEAEAALDLLVSQI